MRNFIKKHVQGLKTYQVNMQMKIYQYRSINIYLLQSLRKKTNWYSKLDYLNDPYECYFYDKTNSGIYDEFRSQLCVCCFSKNMNEILMWSHYADNHKGLCLEFEIDYNDDMRGKLFEIDYHNDITYLEEIKTTSSGYLDLNSKTNGKFIMSKFKTWSYEEELRTYIISENKNANGEERPFLGKLTAIYFGKKSNGDDIELIKHNTTHFKELKYYKVDIDTEKMKIEKVTEI